MERVTEVLYEFSRTYGPGIIGAILILILGRIAAGIARGIVKRLMRKANVDESLRNFVGSLVFALIVIFAAVAALAKFGVETASFVAILGAASFAVGFALQGSLANFAAGVMVLLFRPFKTGDFINAAGVAGTVKEIKLFTTVLATGDNTKIMVPNGKIFGDTIQNFSAYDTRRVDLLIGIGYSSSIGQAMEVMQTLIKADNRVLGDPEPMMAVSELADSSVNIVVRVWVAKADYWGVKFDLTRKIKEAFDDKGIDIPYPQQVVHMINPAG